MVEILRQVKEKLSLFEGMYDIIRIVNPVDKKMIIANEDEALNFNGTCYDYWKKGSSCNNCIAMKATLENDTFVKIEYSDDKIILITATPINIKDTTYIVEIFKDISKDGRFLNCNLNSEASINDLINELNDRAAKDVLKGIGNKKHIKGNLLSSDGEETKKDVKLQEIQLSVLNRKIEELRDSLNEICLCEDGFENDDLRLNVSRYLDELIVDYTIKYKCLNQK